MKTANLFVAILASAIGCGPAVTDRPITTSTPVESSPRVTTNKPIAPDNTQVNQRDRDGREKTPIDQDENKRDVQITADIRKSVLATEGMSVNARNAKIITSQGKVTLRGPVASADEKAKIERIATDVAGEGNVTSELEIAP